MRNWGDYTDEGLQSGVGDEQQSCKDLVFFLLPWLASGSLVVGAIVFWVLYPDLLSVRQTEKNYKEWSAKRVL